MKTVRQADGYTPLWWCVRFKDSVEWMLFDSSAKLAGFTSGEAAADSIGMWQMDYEAASSAMDTIGRSRT